MSKLNKIYYGSAGTGKTRQAMIKAVEIVNEKFDMNIDLNDYEEILKSFKKSSNLLSLDNIPLEHLENIHNSKDEKSLKYNFGKIPREIDISLDEIKTYKDNYNKYPFIETVTFHPSYSYQDFVEGISIETTNENQIIYKAKDGIFKKICDRAKENSNYNYILIIDEINRGDISSIFGELFTLLEDSKRMGEKEELSINLPYSKDDKDNPKKLTIPKNLHILATMNTVDKSIALIDVALRRRFEFIECMPKYDLKELKLYKDIDLVKLLQTINDRITILKNEHYQIGHSYFLNIKDIGELKDVIIKDIIPLLQEYFYDDWQSICAVLNQDFEKTNNNQLLIVNNSNKQLFKDDFNELIEYKNKKVFKINKDFTEDNIKKIYE